MENQKKSELEKIIAEANKLKDIEREEQAQLQKEKEEKRLKKKNNHLEHKWNKFFASFVPSLLRKYEQQDALSHEHAKQCARDIVKILTSKELKKDGAKAPPEEPSKDKRTKVKQFTASYMSKFLLKYRKKHTSRSWRTAGTCLIMNVVYIFLNFGLYSPEKGSALKQLNLQPLYGF